MTYSQEPYIFPGEPFGVPPYNPPDRAPIIYDPEPYEPKSFPNKVYDPQIFTIGTPSKTEIFCGYKRY